MEKIENNSPIPERGKSEIKPEQDSIEEAPKLEWGAELDNMTLTEVDKKVAELESSGERWRLPTLEELREVFEEEDKEKIKAKGFHGSYYWYSIEDTRSTQHTKEELMYREFPSGVYGILSIHSSFFSLSYSYKSYGGKYSVRLVRDIL